MNKKITKVSAIIVVIFLLALSFIDRTPFYAVTFDSVAEAKEFAEILTNKNESVYQITMDLRIKFVEGTSFVYQSGDHYNTSQGQYYIYGANGHVIYCLDPKVMAGDYVSIEELEQINKHMFSKLDEASKLKVITIGYATNELYNQTKDENYLMVGQWLIWDATGNNIAYTSGDYSSYKTDILSDAKLYEGNYQSILNNTLFLDTNGQDLIELDNAAINNDPVTDILEDQAELANNQAPIIEANPYVIYLDQAFETGEDLINLDEIIAADFIPYASDPEDGELTNSAILDTSSVDPTKFGINDVTLKVTDSEGLDAVTTTQLIIASGNAEVIDGLLIDGISLISSYEQMLAYESDVLKYKEDARIYAYDLDNKQEVFATVEELSFIEEKIYNPITNTYHFIYHAKTKISAQSLSSVNLTYKTKLLHVIAPKAGESIPDTKYIISSHPIVIIEGTEIDTSRFEVEAFNLETMQLIEDEPEFDLSQVDIHKPNYTEGYDVTISIDAYDLSMPSKVFVLPLGWVIGDLNEVAITADPIFTNTDTLKQLYTDNINLNNFIIDASYADGVEVVGTEIHEIGAEVVHTNLRYNSKVGIYYATLITSNENDSAMITIPIFVANGDYELDYEIPYIYGEDVVVYVGDEITNDMYNSFAWDYEDRDLTSEIVYPTVATDKFLVTDEILSVVDSDDNYVSTDVIVSVLTDDSFVDSDLAINGHHGITSESSLSSDYETIDEAILSLTEGDAYDMLTADHLDVYVIDNGGMTLESKAGVYYVTIGADTLDGSRTITKDLNIYVTREDELWDGKSPYIHGEDVMVEVSEDITIDMYDALAFDYEDGDLFDQIVYPTVDTSSANVFDEVVSVIDSDGNGATDQVIVTVYDDETVITDDKDLFIRATDFTTSELELFHLEDTKLFTSTIDKFIIEQSNAFAYDLYQPRGLKVDVVETNLTLDSEDGIYYAILSATSNGNTVTTEIEIIVEPSDISISGDDIYVTENELNTYANSLDEFILSHSNYTLTEASAAVTNNDGVLSTNLTLDATQGVYDAILYADSDLQSLQEPIKIFVSNEDEVIDPDMPYIYGENVIINQGELVTKDMYNAIAFDMTDGDLTSDIKYPQVSIDYDNNTPGVYTSKLSVMDYESNYTQTIVTITVMGEDSSILGEEIYIEASDFTTDELDMFETVDEDDVHDLILDKSSAKSYSMIDGTEIDPVINFTDLGPGDPDVPTGMISEDYQAELIAEYNGSTISTTITITVLEVPIRINAHNGFITQDELFNYENSIDQLVVELTEREYLEEVRVDESSNKITSFVFVDENGNVGNELTKTSDEGIYYVKFSAKNSVVVADDVIVSIFVSDDMDVIDDENPYIHGNNVSKKVGTIWNNDFYSAFAFDRQDGNLTYDYDGVSGISYPEIDTSKYSVSLETLTVTDSDGNIGTDEVVVEIYDESTTGHTNSLSINAYDIFTSEDELHGQVDLEAFLKENSYVEAWDLDLDEFMQLDNSEINITYGEPILTLSSNYGVYPVTFSITHDLETVSTDINVYVTHGDDEVDSHNPYIYGENIVVNVDDVISRSDYNPIAFDREDGVINTNDNTLVDIPFVDTSIAGVYPNTLTVVDSDGNTDSHTVYVTVIDDDSNTNEELFIHGLDFKTNELEILDLNNEGYETVEQFIIRRSSAFANNMTTGEDITSSIKVESTNLLPTSIEGDYIATISATQNDMVVTTDINIEVVDASMYLTAFDIYTSESELQAYSKGTIEDFILEKSFCSILTEIGTTDCSDNYFYQAGILSYTDGFDLDSPHGIYDASFYATSKLESISLDIKIYVTHNNELTPSDNPYIYGENVVIHTGDVVDTSDYNALAFDRTDKDLTSSVIYPSDSDYDNMIPGFYTVSLSVSDSDGNTTSREVVVTVWDEESVYSDDLFIRAHDFTTNEVELRNYNNQTEINNFILTKSQAYAYMLADGQFYGNVAESVVPTIKVAGITNKSTYGIYEAKIEVTDGKTTLVDTINITVNHTPIEMSAVDIYTSEDQLHAYSGTVSDFIYEYSNYELTQGIKDIDGNVIDSDFVDPKVVEGMTTDLEIDSNYGVYEAKFKASNSVRNAVDVIINIYVTNDSDLVDDDLPYITAVSVRKEIGTVWDNNFFKAVAFDHQDGDLTSSIVYPDVDTSKFSIAPYTLAVTDSDGNSSEVTVVVEIFGDDTMHNDEVALDAHDIYTNVDTISALSDKVALDQFIIDTSMAQGYDLNTGLETPEVVDSTDLEITSISGVYTATLSTTNGISSITNTIAIHVADNSDLTDDNAPYIRADNVIVNVGDVVSNDIYNGVAFDLKDGDLTKDIVYPVVDTSVSTVKLVQLKVTDSDGNKTSCYVTVTILDDDSNTSIIPDKPSHEGSYIHAVDFTTTELDLAGLSSEEIDQLVIDNAKPYAYDLLDATKLDVVVKSNELFDSIGHDDMDLSTYKAVLSTTSNSGYVADIEIEITVLDSNIEIEAENIFVMEHTLVKYDKTKDSYLYTNSGYDVNVDAAGVSDKDVNIDGILWEEPLDEDYSHILHPLTDFDLDHQQGIYPVTFIASTDLETIYKTVHVYISDYFDNPYDSPNGVDQSVPYLYADSLHVWVGDEIHFNDFNAVAFDHEDGDLFAHVDYSQALTIGSGLSATFDTSYPGVYPATLTVEDSDGNVAQRVVTVTVEDENSDTTHDIDEDVDLRGEDLFITATDIVTTEVEVSEQTNINTFIFEKSQAKGQIVQTGEVLPLSMKTNTLTTTSMQGVYNAQIEISLNGQAATEAITITVLPSDITIKADPIFTSEKELRDYALETEITDELEAVYTFIYEKSNHEIILGNDLEIDDITLDEVTTGLRLDSSQGVYAANFEAENKLYSDIYQIPIYVRNENEPMPNDAPYLYGENVAVFVQDEYDDALEEDIPSDAYKIDTDLYNAVAFDKTDGNLKSQVKYPNILRDKFAVYKGSDARLSVVDSDENSVYRDVVVAVLDKVNTETDIEEDESSDLTDAEGATVAINAFDIFTNEDTLHSYSGSVEEFIREYATPLAYNLDTGAQLDTILDTTDLEITSEYGIYTATFYTQDGDITVSNEIHIYVAYEDDEIDEVRPYLHAESFYVYQDDSIADFKASDNAPDYDNTDFNYYKVVAFDRQDGDLTSVIDDGEVLDVDTSSISAVFPQFHVIDSDGYNTNDNIMVAILDEDDTMDAPIDGYNDEKSQILDQGLITDDKLYVEAHNFSIEQRDLDKWTSTNQLIYSRSDAMAGDLYLEEKIIPQIVSKTEYNDPSTDMPDNLEEVEPGMYTVVLGANSRDLSVETTIYLYIEGAGTSSCPADIYTDEAAIDEAIASGKTIEEFIINNAGGEGTSVLNTNGFDENSEQDIYTINMNSTDCGNTTIRIYLRNNDEHQGYPSLNKNAPYLYAENIVVNRYSSVRTSTYNALSFDLQDQDTTLEIEYPEDVDTSVLGVTTHTLKVTDTAGLTTTRDVTVTVVDADSVVQIDGKRINSIASDIEADYTAPYSSFETGVFLYAKDFATDEIIMNNLVAIAQDLNANGIDDGVEDLIMTGSETFAQETSTGAEDPEHVIETSLVPAARAGVYNAVIQADGSEVVTIEIEIDVIKAALSITSQDIFTNEQALRSYSKTIEDFILEKGKVDVENDISYDNSGVYTYEVNDLSLDSDYGIYEVVLEAYNDIAENTVYDTLMVYVANDNDSTPLNRPYVFGKNIVGYVDGYTGDAAVICSLDEDTNCIDGDITNEDFEAVAWDRAHGDLTDLIIYPDTLDRTLPGLMVADLEVSHDSQTTIDNPTVTIIGDDSVTNQTLYLDAHDIYTNQDTLSTFTNVTDAIRGLSEAQAYLIESGKPIGVTITSTDLILKSEPGVFSATLQATYNGSTVTKSVNIYVVADDEVLDEEQPYIYAKNFAVSVGETADNSMFEAVAFDKKDGEITDSIIYPPLEATDNIGVFHHDLYVVDSDGNRVDTDAEMVVQNEHTEYDTTKTVFLHAVDFTTNELELLYVEDMDEFIIEKGLIDGVDIETGAETRSETLVLNITTKLNQNSKAGTYSVTASVTSRGITVTKVINVTVESAIVEITANDIFTNEQALIDHASDLNQFIIDESNAFAFDEIAEDGSSILSYTVVNTTLDESSRVGHYTATIEATNGIHTDSVDIDIYVARGSDIIDDELPYITTNQVIINVDDEVNNDSFKAYAFDRQDGDITNNIIYPTSYDNLTARVTNYEFGITDSDGNEVSNINTLTVIDEYSNITDSNDAFIRAVDFTTNEIEVTNESDIEQFIIEKSSASAYSMIDGNTLDISIDSDLVNSEGIYTATLNANGAIRTINITVLDATLELEANDIFTNEQTLNEYSGSITDFITAYGNVVMTESVPDDLTTLVIDTTMTKDSTSGIYGATITATSQVDQKVVNITIYIEEKTNVTDDEKPSLYADNIIVLKDSTIDNAMYNAYGFDKDLGDITSSIEYPAVDTSTIGPKDVIITISDGTNTVEKHVVVSVVSDEAVISETTILEGFDTVTNQDTINTYSTINGAIKDLANVIAYDTETGVIQTVIINTLVTKDSNAGIYDVNLSVGEASKDIKFAIANASETLDPVKPYLYAEGFVVKKGDIVTNEMFNAISYDLSDNVVTEITYPSISTSGIGIQTVELSTVDSDGNATTYPVDILVAPTSASISTNSKVAIYASDITTNTSELSEIVDLDTALLTKSGAIAYDVMLKEQLTITIASNGGLTQESEPGMYSVQLTTSSENGIVNTTFVVNVLDSEIHLEASDIATNEDTISSTSQSTEEFILQNAAPKASNGIGTDASEFTYSVVNTTFDVSTSTMGIYSATIMAEYELESHTVTIDIYVANADEVLDTSKPYVYAQDVVVLPGSILNTNSYKARAYDYVDGNLTPSITYPAVNTTTSNLSVGNVSSTNSKLNTTSREVRTLFLDNNAVVSSSNQVAIDADGFSISVTDLASYETVEDAIVDNANIFAVDLNTFDNISFSIDAKDLTLASLADTYEVSITVDNGVEMATKTISVSVTSPLTTKVHTISNVIFRDFYFINLIK